MKDDGGPAFPLGEIFDERRGETVQYASPGMTLRDYFAAKAMQAFLRNEPPHETDAVYGMWAEYAYEMADAMLIAREFEP